MTNDKELKFTTEALDLTTEERKFKNATILISGASIGTQRQWEQLTKSQKKKIEELIDKFFEENTIRNCKAKNALLSKDRLLHYECDICNEKKATIGVFGGEWGEYNLHICLDCLQYTGEE